jgi:hypothetical protein
MLASRLHALSGVSTADRGGKGDLVTDPADPELAHRLADQVNGIA